MDLIIRAAGLEIIGVRLEFLADRVALPLDRLAVRAIEPGERRDQRLDAIDHRIGRVEIARLAGAERGVAVGVGERRGAATGVDQVDRKSTRLNSSHYCASRMPSSA